MGLVVRKLVLGVSYKARFNQPAQLQRLARKLKYNSFQIANNKGADQTARMRRLVCAFVVRKPPKTDFLALRPNYRYTLPFAHLLGFQYVETKAS